MEISDLSVPCQCPCGSPVGCWQGGPEAVVLAGAAGTYGGANWERFASFLWLRRGGRGRSARRPPPAGGFSSHGRVPATASGTATLLPRAATTTSGGVKQEP